MKITQTDNLPIFKKFTAIYKLSYSLKHVSLMFKVDTLFRAFLVRISTFAYSKATPILLCSIVLVESKIFTCMVEMDPCLRLYILYPLLSLSLAPSLCQALYKHLFSYFS